MRHNTPDFRGPGFGFSTGLLGLLAICLQGAFSVFGQTPLLTSPVVVGPWEKKVTLPAEVVPYYRVHLGSPATGWIDSVKVDVGGRVKAGDVLSEIRAPELVASHRARAEEAKAAKQKIAEASALLRTAEALAKAAKSELTRIASLAKSGTVTTKAKDEADARNAGATARVEEARAMILGAEAEALAAAARETEAAAALEYTKITAPFDGLVVERRAELGDFLGPASKRENLFTVEQINPLRIRIQVPEQAATLANAGDSVVVKISGQEFHTTLSRVSGSLDPVTKTMIAEIDLRDTPLLPGAYGTADLKLESIKDAVLVPLAALRTGPDGGRHVVVDTGAGSTKVVPVTFVVLDGVTAVLSSGPANGEKVVLP